jgi:excinuclease ABC subunit A
VTKYIAVHKAEEHNLKKIDVNIPKKQLVVITGPSGSGKSSFLFDTILAESQRRYLESISSYAKQFIRRLNKPKVERITGLPPAISIEKMEKTSNPRSTVGTNTEIYDYLRLLFTHIGVPHCVNCGQEMEQLTAEAIVKLIVKENSSQKIDILSRVVHSKLGTHADILEQLLNRGYEKVRVDGVFYETQDIVLDGRKKHSIDVLVGLFKSNYVDFEQINGILKTALELGDGAVIINTGQHDIEFKDQLICSKCGTQYKRKGLSSFSFNKTEGACPECHGLGEIFDIDVSSIIPSEDLSPLEIFEITVGSGKRKKQKLGALGKALGFLPTSPFSQLTENQREIFLYGDPSLELTYKTHLKKDGNTYWEVTTVWEGLVPWLRQIFTEGSSNENRGYQRLANIIAKKYVTKVICKLCNGQKLRAESLAVKIRGLSIYEISNFTIEDALHFFEVLKLTQREHMIIGDVVDAIIAGLKRIKSVGLDYIHLNRLTRTLSTGEYQRIRLATLLGTTLTDILYCLDEPSIGLHPHDIGQIIEVLQNLSKQGNSVLVIEHDKDTICAADYIIDLGPYAGKQGGELVVEGTPSQVLNHPTSLTAQYLSGKLQISVPQHRRKGTGEKLILSGCKQHNLKDINVELPLGKFICVTGVSGSGKTTLIIDTLYKALLKEIRKVGLDVGKYDDIKGIEHISRVVLVDQSPIGRTPLSNAATYTKTFDYIRELFSELELSRKRGYEKGQFSFNTRVGRCPKCKGAGKLKIKMDFMGDVYITCEDCNGNRYDQETLEVTYKGKNIAEVLSLNISDALILFEDHQRIRIKLQTLVDLGLGYLELGQPATTLSGGEAQRMKIASELWRRGSSDTLYILDEPTTGLSTSDIETLLNALKSLLEVGNTIIVIEHNLEVIKTADWIVDLGPKGGAAGGRIIATGTPEDVSKVRTSYTGMHLRPLLHRDT